MKRILILITLMIFGGEAAAQCNYPSGSTTKRQGLSMTNVKIPTDTSIPVGSILHVHKFGVDRIKNFTCTKAPNDKYVISVDAPVVTGVTGIQGKPVYETGIDGIGFQVSDILRSKNDSLVAAESSSTDVPVSSSSERYNSTVVWLIKTKETIDTSKMTMGTSSISFSVGNLNSNPAPDRLVYLINSISITGIKYRDTSCNISTPRSQVTLNRIDKGKLMSIARGATTPSQKDIAMNVSCPNDSVGNSLTYWFNPIGGISASGDGIVDNILTGTDAAKNVGVIFKLSGNPVTFYDMDKYKYKINSSSDLKKTINLTADYYRQSDNTNDVTMGFVKGMIEVVIQEE
ncbi:fimbrial protein [Klebsiella pneumoniae]|uniref:fimbrial protein n=1 Tax=Klebsiella pneumoniae TaxID=573 RepID=UPI00105AA493|nr:fimbrial protein [Klebsiella pneumoniae]TDJ92615.1 fimbrial protein [Klebsiella pneumoniae]